MTTIIENPKLTDVTLQDLVAALLVPQLVKQITTNVPSVRDQAQANVGNEAYRLAGEFLKHRPGRG